MQALKIDHHGPPSDLAVSDVPRPSVEPDGVLVEVEAAAINPSDIASAQGRFPRSVLPRILGRDFAGRVAEGQADLVGMAVWGTGGDLGISRDGCHADYIALPRAAVSPRPSTLSAEEAAAVGVPFQTAWQALDDRAHLRAGEWVLVTGAAGAVGSAAIQIAAARGAHVIALVRQGGDEARVDGAKVAAFAHTADDDLAEVVRRATGGAGVNVALNSIGGSLLRPLLDVLAEEGRMVVYGVAGGREAQFDLLPFYRADLTLYGLNTERIDAVRSAALLNQLAPLFTEGKLAPPRVATRYPLSRAAEAYQRVAEGAAIGKIILIPDRLYTTTTEQGA